MTKIKDVLTNDGIFTYLNQADDEKFSEIFDADEIPVLDAFYLGTHGERSISPYLNIMVETTDGEVDATSGLQIGKMIWAMYYKNWTRLKYVVDNAEHYDVTYHVSSQDTTITDLDRVETDSLEVDSSVYGFDSTEPQPSETETNSRERTRNTDTTVTKTHEQSGSVGYFSQAQLIKGEYEVEKLDFLHSIFDDISDILCLDIYE